MSNIDKLAELLAHITARPDVFDMGWWVGSPEDNRYDEIAPIEIEYGPVDLPVPKSFADPNLCGTPHCAAGWALALDDQPLSTRKLGGMVVGKRIGNDEKGNPLYRWSKVDEEYIIPEAQRILGLKKKEAYHLFVTLSDSEPLALAYLAKLIAKYTRKEAKVAVRESIQEEYESDAWSEYERDQVFERQMKRLKGK